MKKGVVKQTDYTFTPAIAGSGTIRFSPEYIGLTLAEVMYITNVTSGTATVIYDPADATKGGALNGLTLTLAVDTSTMSSGDALQIIVAPNTSEQNISLENMTMLLKRMTQLLERPNYMTPTGSVRIDNSGQTLTTTINGSLSTLTTLTNNGAGAIDQTFAYYTNVRQSFTAFKNAIIN